MPSPKASRKSKSKSPSRKNKTVKLGANNNTKWGNAMLANAEGLTGKERNEALAALKKFNNAANARRAAAPARGRTMKRERVHLPWQTPSPSPNARPKQRAASPKAKPRKGKVMRECRADAAGCERHLKHGDCKFVHRDEPEWAMLRPEQKL
jgi:hypothetical protein